MLKSLKQIRRITRSFLYRNLVNKFKKTKTNPTFKIIEYKDENGNFDYRKYQEEQIAGNHRKLDVVWVSEKNIQYLSQYIKNRIHDLSFGICHGTRNGAEQKFFKKYLNIDIIGTEISDTATQFPDTIQWDFHQVNPAFTNRADFIYSNSFDHAYDPKKAINAWLDALKQNDESICILEHTSGHTPDAVDELDPFGADIEIMPSLIKEWTGGKYEVKEILEAPDIPLSVTYVNFLIIGRANNAH